MSSSTLLAAATPTRVLATGAHQPAPSTGLEVESAPPDLDLVDVITDQLPDVVVIDLATSTADPLRLCRAVVEQAPATAVVAADAEDRLGDAYQLLRLGAVGWITVVGDATTSDRLSGVVEATARSEAIFHRRHAAWILNDYARLGGRARAADPRYSITSTEREVLERLAAGHQPDEVAALHDVTPHTVNRHARIALTRLQRAVRRR